MAESQSKILLGEGRIHVPIASLSREKLHLLADTRIEEASVLLRHQYWTGAYYFTGLAVECALKACVAKAVRGGDFPDKSFINRAYTHRLEELVRLDDEIWKQLNTEIETDVKLAANWSTVLRWNDENRYSVVEAVTASSLYAATTVPAHGVMEWIRRRW